VLQNSYLEFVVPNTSKYTQQELEGKICQVDSSTGPIKSALGGSIGKAPYAT